VPLAEHIGMGFLLYHTLSATQHMKLSKAPVSKSKTRYSKQLLVAVPKRWAVIPEVSGSSPTLQQGIA